MYNYIGYVSFGDDSSSSGIFKEPHRTDFLTYKWIALRNKFLLNNILLTDDIKYKFSCDFHLHLNCQKNVYIHPSFCILLENSYLYKRNSDNKLLSRYKHVFSWDNENINHKSVTSFLLGHYLNCYDYPAFPDSRSILVSMFAANKCLHSGVVKPDVDLYNERVKVINWYEKNAPYSLHLYGSKWSHYPAPRFLPSFPRTLINAKLKRIKQLRVWRGYASSKYQLLRKSKFNFAYENVQLKRNYITEKIFDSMNCLTVPIYRGPLNTFKLIPQSTYIDPCNFRNHAELYLYLTTMSDQEYQSYLSSIHSFVNSDRSIAFKADKFAGTIVKNIIPLLS